MISSVLFSRDHGSWICIHLHKGDIYLYIWISSCCWTLDHFTPMAPILFCIHTFQFSSSSGPIFQRKLTAFRFPPQTVKTDQWWQIAWPHRRFMIMTSYSQHEDHLFWFIRQLSPVKKWNNDCSDMLTLGNGLRLRCYLLYINLQLEAISLLSF